MKLYVGVTDNDWFRFLAARPELDEVNFWQPGGNRLFRTLQIGEPFLFKLHAPRNFIVGGGFFAHASILPASLAWEAFGEKNGAETFSEMRARIVKYRRGNVEPHDKLNVGCIILTQPFFLQEDDWIPVPKDFSLNIVQGKSYDMTEGTGRELWERVQGSLPLGEAKEIAEEPTEMYGAPTLIRTRLGQGSFRVMVTDTYERSCAISHERALPVLEAAHIQAVSEGGQHRVDNGLLLRSDIHRLYDAGYITVTPDYKVRVSHKLKDDFDNGDPYYPYDKTEIWLPPSEPRPPQPRASPRGTRIRSS